MTDFLILGGGMAGASAGFFLADHGSVTILEKEDALGYHSTGRSAALFTENYGSPSIRALSVGTRPFLEAPPAGFADEALALCPVLRRGRFARAMVEPTAMDMDVHAIHQGFLRGLRAKGGKIVTGAASETLAQRDGLWQVRTP